MIHRHGTMRANSASRRRTVVRSLAPLARPARGDDVSVRRGQGPRRARAAAHGSHHDPGAPLRPQVRAARGWPRAWEPAPAAFALAGLREAPPARVARAIEPFGRRMVRRRVHASRVGGCMPSMNPKMADSRATRLCRVGRLSSRSACRSACKPNAVALSGAPPAAPIDPIIPDRSGRTVNAIGAQCRPWAGGGRVHPDPHARADESKGHGAPPRPEAWILARVRLRPCGAGTALADPRAAAWRLPAHLDKAGARPSNERYNPSTIKAP